jgi:hypothetical protein
MYVILDEMRETETTMTDHKFTWEITASTKYHSPQAIALRGELWDDVRTDTYTGDGPGLEAYVLEFTKDTVIGVDDERFEGDGNPISTTITIEYTPERKVEGPQDQ